MNDRNKIDLDTFHQFHFGVYFSCFRFRTNEMEIWISWNNKRIDGEQKQKLAIVVECDRWKHPRTNISKCNNIFQRRLPTTGTYNVLRYMDKCSMCALMINVDRCCCISIVWCVRAKICNSVARTHSYKPNPNERKNKIRFHFRKRKWSARTSYGERISIGAINIFCRNLWYIQFQSIYQVNPSN